jgi:membrane fusion protein (multidrug efflux system)
MHKANPWGFYLVLGLLIFGLAGCGNRPPAREEEPEARIAEVEVSILEQQPWVETINSFGAIEAAEEIVVTTDFSERVKRVRFAEGDRVKAGQLLIELDSRKAKLRVTQSRTALEETKATLANARKTLKRREVLFARGNISQSKLEEAQLAAKTGKAHHDDALAAVQLAERELADRKIISPVGGLVEKRSVNPGETVMSGAPLAVIQAVDAMQVVTYVTEKDINHLRLGSEAKVTTPGVQGRTYTGRIESLGAKANPSTGNFSVKLTILNAEGLLRPGMTARVWLQGTQYQDAILLPDSALVDRNRHRVAYKVVAGKAVEVEPLIALSTVDRVHILSGLQAGDQLIVEGLANVVDGTPVKVIEKDATPDSGS